MPVSMLICPFLAVVSRPDFAGTAADPDGAGPLSSGYDTVFRRPRLIPSNSQVGTTALLYRDAVEIPCQWGTSAQARSSQGSPGNDPQSQKVLVFLFKDLRRLGLVLSNGEADFPRQSRLDRIIRKVTRDVIWEPDDAQAFPLYAQEVQDRGPGLSLSNPSKNLLVVTFSRRTKTTP